MASYEKNCFMNGVALRAQVPQMQDSWTTEQSRRWVDFVIAAEALYTAFLPERIRRQSRD